MIVRPASRMFRAISFGVFWRAEPSTRAIIRSRKVSPGRAGCGRRHVRQDGAAGDGRAVAAGSLITGADSPVIADSLTSRCLR